MTFLHNAYAIIEIKECCVITFPDEIWKQRMVKSNLFKEYQTVRNKSLYTLWTLKLEFIFSIPNVRMNYLDPLKDMESMELSPRRIIRIISNKSEKTNYKWISEIAKIAALKSQSNFDVVLICPVDLY